jgi:hypothetical protein
VREILIILAVLVIHPAHLKNKMVCSPAEKEFYRKIPVSTAVLDALCRRVVFVTENE